MFNRGDRVIFNNNAFGYRISERNPYIGSEFFCEGTVSTTGSDTVYVDWDNGCSNDYRCECLSHIFAAKDPNILFKRTSYEI